MTSIDAVTVTRDTRELTLGCVASVVGSRDGKLEISMTVVDNASSDGTGDALAESWPEVRVLRNADNVGYGSACNQGLRGGSGEYVLILNSDVLARPTAVPRLVEFMGENRGHVAAGGRLVDPGTDDVQVGHNVRAFPRLGTQVAQLLGLEAHWPSNPLSRRYLGLDVDYSRTQDVDQPPGSCLIVRRAAFDALDGFDEGFFYWYEDVDLVRRLRDRGRIAYVHDATFEHVGGASFARWNRPESIGVWYPSLFRYFAKHRPRWELVALRGLAAAVGAIRAVGYLPFDRGRARACWDTAKLAASSGARLSA